MTMVRIGHDEIGYETLDQAHWAKNLLVEAVQHIDTQLACRRPLPGVRLPIEEYEALQKWRGDALVARKHALRQLRIVKDFISRGNRQRQAETSKAAGINQDDAMSLIVAAHELLHRIATETDIDPDEQIVIDALRDCIDRHQHAEVRL